MYRETDYAGIDYGLGEANIDRETGIRVGVIALNAEGLTPWLYEELEPEYGEPTCPHCLASLSRCDGIDADELDDYERYHHSCDDYACRECRLVVGSEYAFPDEPLAQHLSRDGYGGVVHAGDFDLMITRSPYFTRAQFCSPCAPGAVHLEHPCPDGERGYCLGHELFESGRAPYPVWRVADGAPVPPPGGELDCQPAQPTCREETDRE